MGAHRIAALACLALALAGCSSRDELRQTLGVEGAQSLARCLRFSGVAEVQEPADLWFASYLSPEELTVEYRPTSAGPGVSLIQPTDTRPEFIVFAVAPTGDARTALSDPTHATWVGYLWAPLDRGRLENAERDCI